MWWVISLHYPSGTVKAQRLAKAPNVIAAELKAGEVWDKLTAGQYVNARPCNDYQASHVLKLTKIA